MTQKITTPEFIKRARKIHGNKYNYDETNYINSDTEVIIICPEHGRFTQTATKHINTGRGCWECGKKSCVEATLEKRKNSFLNKAFKKFKNLFTYNIDEYKNNSVKITISCKKHGEFRQTPSCHLATKYGCPYCAYDNKRNNSKDKNHYINKFNEYHKNKYDYSLTPERFLSEDIITILCQIHGKFDQKVSVHYRSGCPLCGNNETSKKLSKIPKELRKTVSNYKRRVRDMFINRGFKKESSNLKIIGCSWLEFKVYLEDNPYGFTIEDDGLDLDHIIPISSAKNEEELYSLCHYTNFQLLPSYYNQHIKRTNKWDEEDFKKWYINEYKK